MSRAKRAGRHGAAYDIKGFPPQHSWARAAHMSDLLFVYGTLRDPDLLSGVLNRPLNAEHMLPATAPGFAAVHYPNRIYPALVRTPGAAAEGLVLTVLSPFVKVLLVGFVGPEYRRVFVPVMIAVVLHVAFAYL